MKAIVVGEDRGLSYREVPEPACGAEEALVEVAYTALNRADLSQRAGHYPPPAGASEILGLECAGVIRRLPPGYRGAWREGDEVCALLSGGGYAERVCVPTQLLMPIPRGWTLAEAAAMPEAFYTAFLNLFLEAGLEPGERALIHGGASGVGTAAIQLAREAGATVYATAGRDDKVALCRELGASVAVNYRETDFAEVLGRKAPGVDMILDMVGAEYLGRNLGLLNVGGRLVVIATLSGSRAEIDLRALMACRASVKGSTLRSRPLDEKVRIKEAFVARFWEALESGRVKPVIDRSYPIAEAEAAQERMRRNETVGKVVLEVGG